MERDLIDGVISSAGQPLLQHQRPRHHRRAVQAKTGGAQGKIVLLNASQRVGKGRPKNYIPEDDIRPIAAAFLKGEPVEGEVTVITREQAAEADYNLSPSRWVGQADAVDQRPLSEIIADMRRLDEEAARSTQHWRECWYPCNERSVDMASLGELFEIGAGKTMSAAARNGADKTPFLRTSNVLWDEIDLSSIDEMSIPEHELPTKLLRRGDLLVCEGGEIGRAAIWSGEVETMSFQNHLHRLRPIAPDVESRFYVFFLQSAFTQLGIFEGVGNKTTIPNLSRSRLAGWRCRNRQLVSSWL